MATYAEIVNLLSDPAYQGLKDRTAVASSVKAHEVSQAPTPSAEAKAWAVRALTNPREESEVIINFVLAANVAATATQILTANDATLQAAVNDAVDTLLGA